MFRHFTGNAKLTGRNIMSRTQILLAVCVALYMCVMLLIGFWCRRRISDTKDFIVAGRRLGWMLSLGTIFATWFGSETCMGSSSMAFEEGILGVISDPFGAGLCLILAGIFLVKILYRLDAETIVDYFEMRYGTRVGKLLSILYLPVYLGWVGGQLLAFGIILNALVGIPALPATLLSTAVVLVYTYAGGMWAVAVTDLFQMFFILIGLLVMFPLILVDLGGWHSIQATIGPEAFHWYPRDAGPVNWLVYIEAWMIVGIGSLPAQDLFQRVMSPKSEKIARWSAVSAGCMYMVIGLLPVLLGIMGRMALPADNTGGAVLIDLALKYLPLPIVVLMVSALLSAIMSTVDSALLAPAGIIGHNIVHYFKPGAGEEEQLRWCKRSIFVVGIVSLILALYFKNIYTLCTQSWGVLLVGVAAPMLGGMFWKKANAKGALASALSGTAFWILCLLVLPEGHPTNLYGFIMSSVVLVVVSLLTHAGSGESHLLVTEAAAAAENRGRLAKPRVSQ